MQEKQIKRNKLYKKSKTSLQEFSSPTCSLFRPLHVAFVVGRGREGKNVIGDRRATKRMRVAFCECVCVPHEQ